MASNPNHRGIEDALHINFPVFGYADATEPEHEGEDLGLDDYEDGDE